MAMYGTGEYITLIPVGKRKGLKSKCRKNYRPLPINLFTQDDCDRHAIFAAAPQEQSLPRQMPA